MVTSKEHRWILIFAVVVMVVTSLPYLLGFARQGSNWFFTGFFFGVEDGNSYIAKMVSGAAGAWLFHSPYTAYPQSGFLAFLPYLLLGKFASPPGLHEQLVALFQLYRCLAGVLCIIATYDFIAVFIHDYRLRRLGTAIATIGGGLGWLSIVGLGKLWQGGLPLEFYSPESFGFLSLLGLPHLAMARALLLWGLVSYLKPVDQPIKYWKNALLPGILWLLLGLMQPLTVVIGWVILGSHLGLWGLINYFRSRKGELIDWIEWKEYFKRAIGMIFMSSPIVIYTIISFMSDSYLKEWSLQNIILSPPVFDYFLAYGLILPFTIAGIRSLLQGQKSKVFLIFGWLLAFPFLAYFPYNLQRRLPEAVWVSLVILAMSSLVDKNRASIRKISWLLYSTFIIPIILLAGGIITTLNPEKPIFIPKQEQDAFQYLANHSNAGDVLLASYETSNAAPAWAPVNSLIGHGPESIHLATLKPEVDSFYNLDTPDNVRLSLIKEFQIKFILIGPPERELGSWEPAPSMNASLVYNKNGWKLYIVNQSKP